MSPRPAKAVRGRAGDDPATALRDLLIDTAERLIGDRQASTITTREIARAAGVSDGVLYNYFADKNELIITALVRRHTETLRRYDVALPKAGTATVAENLTACALAVIELVTGTLPMARTLLPEADLLHRFIDEIHRTPLGPHRMVGPVAAYLAEEQRLGRLGEFDIEPAATLLLGSAVMQGFTIVMGGAPQDQVIAQVPRVVATLLRGLSPGSPHFDSGNEVGVWAPATGRDEEV
jgi:AcrR family transcriptional regulator